LRLVYNRHEAQGGTGAGALIEFASMSALPFQFPEKRNV
jgi:hypothetical protein